MVSIWIMFNYPSSMSHKKPILTRKKIKKSQDCMKQQDFDTQLLDPRLLDNRCQPLCHLGGYLTLTNQNQFIVDIVCIRTVLHTCVQETLIRSFNKFGPLIKMQLMAWQYPLTLIYPNIGLPWPGLQRHPCPELCPKTDQLSILIATR